MVYIKKESKIEEYNRLKQQGKEKEYWDKYYPNRKMKDETKKKPGETNSGNKSAMNNWLEGERKLNERAKKEKERQNQRQADAKKQIHQILTNWPSNKKK